MFLGAHRLLPMITRERNTIIKKTMTTIVTNSTTTTTITTAPTTTAAAIDAAAAAPAAPAATTTTTTTTTTISRSRSVCGRKDFLLFVFSTLAKSRNLSVFLACGFLIIRKTECIWHDGVHKTLREPSILELRRRNAFH